MKKAIDAPAKPRGRPRSFDRDVALESALNVFWKHGYEATSLCDLTAAMGINPPSLYAAFGDKEQLFMEAIDRYAERRRQALAPIYEQEPTARGAIERVLMRAVEELSQPGTPRGCMLVLSAINCADASAHIQSALAERRAASRARLKARIDRAVKEGELAADTDTAALADFYTAVLQGMSHRARDGASRKSLIATAQTALRAWPQSARKSVRKTKAEAPSQRAKIDGSLCAHASRR